MSRKLLARGKKKLESQLPLNRQLRIQQSESLKPALEVPQNFKQFALLCRIRSGSEIVPFELWDWQEELSSVADRFNVCCLRRDK
jgi:hypothetical protein